MGSRSSSIALTHTSCFFPCFISLFHRVQVHVASLIQRWWLLRVIQYKLLLRVNHQQDETHLAMASLVVRSILLATFVYSYLLLSTWFQLLPTWNTTLPLVQCSGVQSSRNANGETSTCPSCFPPWSVPDDQCESPADDLFSGIEKNSLLWISWVLINALTILDLVLSRRTKPLRFVLRILYRIGRSNIKWALLWFMWHVSLDFGPKALMNQLMWCIRHVTQTDYGRLIHQVWMVIQRYPIWCCLSFGVYCLVIGSILHRLMPRSDGRNRRNSDRRQRNASVPSKWALLIELLFRPVSYATANNLNDVDFELDDSMDLLLERLALPNLWLTPVVPTDYLKYLPIWQFGSGWNNEHLICNVMNQKNDNVDVPKVVMFNDDYHHPLGMIPSCECAICLEKYRSHIYLCGLPCGHHFHHGCIMNWLQRDNHHCPICRWPAYRNKNAAVI